MPVQSDEEIPAMGQLERIESLLALLTDDWRSYEELIATTGRLERTLRRDLQRIERLGYPLETRWEGSQKRFRIRPGPKTRPIEPGILEVIAANLGRGVLGFLAGTELCTQMEALFSRLRESSRASERQLRDLDRKFWFMADAPRDYHSADEALNDLITCILDQRVAQLTYRSRSRGLEQLQFRPYTLIVRRECLYVLGKLDVEGLAQDELRLLDVTRVERVKRLRSAFELPENWQPDEAFKDTFGVFLGRPQDPPPSSIQIWFEGQLGSQLQSRNWHPSQRWTTSAEGGWQLELKVRVCPELVHWLLGFGASARVIGPPALRTAVQKELKEALARYTR